MLSRLVGSVTQALDFNAATLSGCIDIIVVPQEDGSLRSTPFHVRFGKARVLRSRNKTVELKVNGDKTGIRMTLGAAGEAYFIQEAAKSEGEEEEETSWTAPASTVQERVASGGVEEDIKELEVAKLRDSPPKMYTSELITGGASSPLHHTMSATDNHNFTSNGFGNLPFDIEFSVCGHILQGGELDVRVDNDVFEANKLRFDVINSTPELWYHPSLVARFNKEPPFYPAKAAMPVVMTLLTFKKTMSPDAVFRLMNSTLTVTPPEGSLAQILSSAGLAPLAQLVEQKHPHDIKSPAVRNNNGGDGDNGDSGELDGSNLSPTSSASASAAAAVASCSLVNTCLSSVESERQESELRKVIEDSVIVKDAEKSLDIVLDSGIKRTLRPSSDMLKKMNLTWGENQIEFCLSGTTQSVHGTICLWERDAKIVVSDVDGTITRSDVMGQLAPMVGKDWSHTAVTKLFSRIQTNGFHMLYLTARAIGQADITRDYLFGLADGASGNVLPKGPLFLSPDRLFTSFKREVIDRTPFIFKIAALRDIRGLFPPSYNPFYAGFGNRDTDHKAYTHIGIPEGKVFIINSQGIVHHVNSAYATSYDSMADIAHQMFPHLDQTPRYSGIFDENVYLENVMKLNSSTFWNDDEFNQFDFWARPLPLVDSALALYQEGGEGEGGEEDEGGDKHGALFDQSLSDPCVGASRPLSQELLALRRSLLRGTSEPDFDVDVALDVSAFSELAQIYTVLNDFIPHDSAQAQQPAAPESQIGTEEATNADAAEAHDSLEFADAPSSTPLDDQILLEKFIETVNLSPSDALAFQANLWQNKSLLVRLEDRLWAEMLELRQIYSEQDMLEEVTSRVLGYPIAAAIIDPEIYPLDPVPAAAAPSSSSYYFGWPR
eukprot:GHVH01007069.1.p1 GENE.GHVH01007069.1~~GHVH01007069.1.p1  ORF type:complete len:889 (-),score=113.86 GHVH01007069.1:387-3053(-)